MVWDPVWEEVFKNQAWGKYPTVDIIRFIARNFYRAGNRKNIKLLELGCGPGANLWYMSREGFTVYGIDASQTAIAQAEERLNRECPGWTGELKVGDIVNLPFDDELFDGVIDSEAISCNSYEDAKAIYTEMARVTKKGGKLFSQTFATGCWGDGTGEKVGHNSWIVSEGPLLNKGYARFTDYNEIHNLVSTFSITEIELLTRTIDNRQHEVKEWIICGEKTAGSQ
jgi:ubiquinone/menaquinone biosynthesis C-methylase UbiE